MLRRNHYIFLIAGLALTLRSMVALGAEIPNYSSSIAAVGGVRTPSGLVGLELGRYEKNGDRLYDLHYALGLAPSSSSVDLGLGARIFTMNFQDPWFPTSHRFFAGVDLGLFSGGEIESDGDAGRETYTFDRSVMIYASVGDRLIIADRVFFGLALGYQQPLVDAKVRRENGPNDKIRAAEVGWWYQSGYQFQFSAGINI